MLVQDMKNACTEEIIELIRADKEKNEVFKMNEAVKLLKQGEIVVVRNYDSTKTPRFVPANSHASAVVDHVMNNLEFCLCEVVNNKKDRLIVMIKQYPICSEMDVAVLVKDEFIRTKLQKQKQFRNVTNPYPELREDSVYSPDGNSEYFVVGKHVRKDTDDKEEFVIAATDYYLSVRKKYDDGKEYFEIEKFSRGLKVNDYAFFLVRGSLKFSDEKSEIKERIREILPTKNDLYINVWNDYGRLEAQMILDHIRTTGAIHFDSYELAGYGVVVYFYLNSSSSEKKLTHFAENVKKGDMISILPFNPFQDASDAVDLRNVFESKDVSANTVDGKIAEEINPQSGRIAIAINDENFARLKRFSSGYIYISFRGDKRRLERRERARLNIETMTCPMPELNAIMEGRRASTPKKTNIPPLSPGLLADPKFSNLTPNQIEAIRIALNTPDMAIIQGPPGTGKTTVITAIIKRLEEEADTEGGMFGRSLITAFQHDAVQNATDRLRILGLPAIKFGKKYSDVEDDSLEINLTIQHWINEKLTDLNSIHTDVRDVEYMSEFNRLYVNYLKSAVSLEQTLEILRKIRSEVENMLSVELNDRLTSVINSIQFQIKGENNESDVLIRAIRRIPTSEVIMKDNGRGVLRIAVTRLERTKDDFLTRYIEQIKEIINSETVDYAELKRIKREILVHIIPKDKVFTGQGKREEIDLLLCEISEYLHKQIQQSKKGEDLIFLEYMQSLEDNPMAVKKTILDYSVVNGATNQQVMSKEISDLKNSDIVYDNVLVDEAARSNPLDLFIPMSVAKDKIIMVGDHRQLPHIIDDEVVRKLEDKTPESDLKGEIDARLKQSMFQQLFYKLQDLEKQEPKIPRVITLDRQFRMHPSIGSFINDNFYKIHGENVENGIQNVKNFEHFLPGLQGKACVWYDAPLSLGKERADKSKSRYIEAKKIAEHLKKMLDSPEGKKYSYGIITFYRDQVDVINEVLASDEIGILIKGEGEHYSISPNYWNNKFGDEEYIKVGTVDAFQGREFDVVYLSMVRSNSDEIDAKPIVKEGVISSTVRNALQNREKQLRAKYGFLMFENRLCVAMSRGKKLLICVGDSGMVKGEAAQEAIPSLVNFYNLCNGGDEYGQVIK